MSQLFQRVLTHLFKSNVYFCNESFFVVICTLFPLFQSKLVYIIYIVLSPYHFRNEIIYLTLTKTGKSVTIPNLNISCKTINLLKLKFFTFLSTDLKMEARNDRQRFHGQLFGRLLVSITVVTPDLGSRAQVLGLCELL